MHSASVDQLEARIGRTAGEIFRDGLGVPVTLPDWAVQEPGCFGTVLEEYMDATAKRREDSTQ